MDLQGSLVNTNISIYPSDNLINYIKLLPINENVPINIAKLAKGEDYEIKQIQNDDYTKKIPVYLNDEDIKHLDKIKAIIKIEEAEVNDFEEKNISKNLKCEKPKDDPKETSSEAAEDANENSIENFDKINATDQVEEAEVRDFEDVTKEKNASEDLKCGIPENDPKGTSSETAKDTNNKAKKVTKEDCNEKTKADNKEDKLHLLTSDIDWLYDHLQQLRKKGEKDVPYLYELLEGAEIKTPINTVLKRNPELEARCVKLRAQQEAREYRQMTKSVDNVRMRFPEDSISYQLKQVNRQLIAIGQFIISIFAGFLFGFKGVEWTIGPLDFGFRLLLGVMCALVIALAEIYFLAKKLNEELNVPETTQLGGPPKFADQKAYPQNFPNRAIDKEHKN